jgi:hypothetical protein
MASFDAIEKGRGASGLFVVCTGDTKEYEMCMLDVARVNDQGNPEPSPKQADALCRVCEYKHKTGRHAAQWQPRSMI